MKQDIQKFMPKKHEFKRCNHCFLLNTPIYIIPLIVALCLVEEAKAQPNSQGCLAAKKVVADLTKQIHTLETKKGTVLYAGPKSGLYKEAMDQLMYEYNDAVKIENQACADLPTQQAEVVPKFLVLTVIYAPPGLDGGKSTGYVDYGSVSQTGSSIASSHTFKQEAGVTATASVGPDAGGFGGSASVGFNVTASTTDKTQLDIKKSQGLDIKVSAPSADGVDHAQDQIWIWIKPKVSLISSGTSISWSLNNNNQVNQYLTVGQLKKFLNDPTTVDKDAVGKQLKAIGFTQSDYSTILSADPFGNGSVAIDTLEFTQLAQRFTYEPQQPGAGTTLTTYPLKNEAMSTGTHGTTGSKNLNVSMTLSAGIVFKASLKTTEQWTWTNESSATSSADDTQSATLGIGQPSASYQGFTSIEVYWDNIWKSFLFVPSPLTESLMLSGTTKNLQGEVVPHQQVTLQIGTSRMITYSSVSGHYSFYGPKDRPTQSAVLLIGNTKKTLSITTQPTVVN